MIDQFEKLKSGIIDWIWDPARLGATGWKRSVVTTLRIGYLVIRDLLEGLITLRAMGLVYTTLLSLVPLLAVSFSVLKGFGVHNQIEPLLLNVLSPLGAKSVEITSRIIEFVENMKAGVLGFVGLAFLIFTVVSLIQKIERAFNYSWHVGEHRPLAQRFSNYLSVILIGPVLLFSAIGITASFANAELVHKLMEVEAIGALVQMAAKLIPFVLVITAFTVIYIFVPNTKVKATSALVGAATAGILWETAGLAFASFVVNSAKYTAIYSAFATLILFMIWIYLSWLILLIGANIAFYHQHPEYRKLQRRLIQLGNRLKEKVTLVVMALISKNYYEGKPAWSLESLSKELNIMTELLAPLMTSLVERNILVRTDDVPPNYIPAQAPEQMTLKKIVDAVRATDGDDKFLNSQLPRIASVETCFSEMEQGAGQVLAGRTLKDLATMAPDVVAQSSSQR